MYFIRPRFSHKAYTAKFRIVTGLGIESVPVLIDVDRSVRYVARARHLARASSSKRFAFILIDAC